MKFEVVIDSRSTEVVIALLNDGKLIELRKQQHDNNYSVGDIYLGKVNKITPGLNAAFVKIGHEKDAFLHYLDLGSQIRSLKKFTEKTRSKKNNTASLKNFRKEKETLKEYDQYNVNSFSIKKNKITTSINVLQNSIVFTRENSLKDFKIEHKEK